jgi:hypothetical protein
MTWFLPVLILGGLLPVGIVGLWLALGLVWVMYGHHVRGWRVRSCDREHMRYSQSNGGRWDAIEFPFERLATPPRLFLGDAESWGRRPEWAKHQRDLITSRIERALPKVIILHEELADSPPNKTMQTDDASRRSRSSQTLGPMYRVRVVCEGLTPEEGADAPVSILEEFTHRAWHKNVRCEWDGLLLRLEADNDYDARGQALLDEFSDAVVACVACEGTIAFKVEAVDVLSDKG